MSALPLRALVTVATATLLALTGLALPAWAAPTGIPIAPAEGGTVVSWGGGGYPGTTPALDGRTVTAIAAGGFHNLALTSDGALIGWGNNVAGQADVPASLAGKTVTAIDAGRYHSIALTSDGVVTAWGSNDYGQAVVPASLAGKTVTAIAAGYYHNLALTSDGTITAWGYNDAGAANVPASLADKTVTAVAAGHYNSFAVTSDGQVTGWGYNYYGQNNPPASLAGKTVTALSAGVYHTLAVTSDGKVTAWGGDPSTGEGIVPASLADKTVVAVAAGFQSSFALTSDGKVVGWGTNAQGQTTLPAGLDAHTVTALSAGENHVIAVVRTVLPVSRPAITGTPQVGSTLTAVDGPYNAAPDSVSYQWQADGSDVGTDSAAYTPGPADAGKTVTVTVTATKGGYAPSTTSSAATAAVANGTFTTAPTATISGTSEVGQSLTADEGAAAPAPDAYAYRWFADGTPIAGAVARSFTLTAAQRGAALTVEVTAVRAGYDSATDLSEATGVVGAGRLTVTGSLSVDGIPEVGEKLTATSTVETTPSSTQSGQWLRDGLPVAGETAATYTLTNADAGAVITHQVTAARDGYDDVAVTSDAVGPVEGGVITASVPTIEGTPTVDTPLTGSVTGFEPADAAVSLDWKRGTAVVGSGSTYTPTADDAGHQLTLTATFTKNHFDATTSSATTAVVAQAVFTANPEATITGTAKVGELLTAAEGAAAPTPDAYGYRWFADGEEITGADARTLRLSTAQKNKAVTVEVTATRPGYRSASDLSEPTGVVATSAAPTIDLTVAKARIRRAQATILTWTSEDATSLSASRGWTGARQSHGTETVRPTRIGTTTYVLRASNENGITTAQVAVAVRREARRLNVAAANGLRLRGHKVAVRAAGLDRGERYKIRVAGNLVATGRASRAGRVERRILIPTSIREGRATVSVAGSERDRLGTDTVRVVRNKRLGMRLAHGRVRASDDQTVTIIGLAAGERTTVTYQGRRISPRNARANAQGTWTRTFDVDIDWGTKTVQVVGQYPGRVARETFEVVRRCPPGVPRCR